MKETKTIHSLAVLLTKRDGQLFFMWLLDSRAQPELLRKLIEKYRGKFVKTTAREDVLAILRTGGLQKSNMTFIAKKFQLTGKAAAAVAGISERAYRGWEGGHPLSSNASEHLLKIVEVYRSGMQLFDNNKHTLITWMNLEIPALGQRVPVKIMTSSMEGADIVNNQLGCMEYGILT